MTVLQCEICGGKLIGRPGGIFECEFCGTVYDTAWARGKLHQIKGTVKVEGTVEVKGTVKLDGPVEVKSSVSVENMLKRGHLALEAQNWKDAEKYYDDALNLNAECVDAYLGKCCAAYHIVNIRQIHLMAKLWGEKLLTNNDLKKCTSVHGSF